MACKSIHISEMSLIKSRFNPYKCWIKLIHFHPFMGNNLESMSESQCCGFSSLMLATLLRICLYFSITLAIWQLSSCLPNSYPPSNYLLSILCSTLYLTFFELPSFSCSFSVEIPQSFTLILYSSSPWHFL